MTAVARANRGGRRIGGSRPRQTAASVAAAVTVVLVILAAAADASVFAAPAVGAPAPATRLGTADREAATADNASADPITAAWEAKLREAAAAALPPLPSARHFRRHQGLFTLHVGVGLAAGQALLEVSKAQLDMPFVLATEFSALDARTIVTVEGVNRRQEAFFLSPNLVFAFRLAPDTAPPKLQLYRPPLHKRSVDPTSEPGKQAMARMFATTVQSFAGRPIGNGCTAVRLYGLRTLDTSAAVEEGFPSMGGDGSSDGSSDGGGGHGGGQR